MSETIEISDRTAQALDMIAEREHRTRDEVVDSLVAVRATDIATIDVRRAHYD